MHPFTLDLSIYFPNSQEEVDSGLEDTWDFDVDSPSEKTGTVKRRSSSSTDSSPSSSEVYRIFHSVDHSHPLSFSRMLFPQVQSLLQLVYQR